MKHYLAELSFVCVALMALITTSETSAAVPGTMNYQGRLTNPSGQNVADGNYNVRFTLYDAASIGTSLWAETLSVAVTGGLCGVQLGAVHPLTAGLFSSPDRWLGIAVGIDPEINPRIKFTTVAYAFAIDAGGGGYLPLSGGTMTGPITNTGDPAITMGKGSFGSGNLNPGAQAFVAGMNNRARGDYSVVAGGGGPTAADSNGAFGLQSAVGGGTGNFARGWGGFIGGGVQNSASRNFSTVCGGYQNVADTFAFIGGGSGNQARSLHATVAGGSGNQSQGSASAIGGGVGNVATGETSTVSGGLANSAAGKSSSVGGGQSCSAAGTYAGVFSGNANVAGKSAADTGAFVGGGVANAAQAKYSTVAGGADNLAQAQYGTVAGGQYDTATWSWATVGGGYDNKASGEKSFVGGGGLNVASGWGSAISGGYGNVASNDEGVVVGGLFDTATGQWAVAAGGNNNVAAGQASFAAGHGARATDDGCLVWADNSGSGCTSDRTNQVKMAANGGVKFAVNGYWVEVWYDGGNRIINSSTSAFLSTAGVWTNASDRNLKENFSPIDGKELLAKIDQLPVTRWNYKVDDDSVTHIGPTAQDFYSAFEVGSDKITISTIDPSGIALAAIQELNRQNKDLKKQNEALKSRLDALQERVERMLSSQK